MGDNNTLDSLISTVMDRINDTLMQPEDSLVLASVLEKLEGVRAQRAYTERFERESNGQ